jgi:hypothetical protein
MERRKEGNYTQENNSIQVLVGNEENGYPVPDCKKTMINVTNEPSDTHKKIPQRGNHEEITEKFMEKLQDTVNQKVQDALQKFQDTSKNL